MAETKARDPLLEEADEIYSAYATRRAADADLVQVFTHGTLTGKLYEALGINIKDSSSTHLLVNLVRAAAIDRTRMLSMLPDSKFDVPFTADEDIALTEQDVLINLHQTMWDFWRMKSAIKVGAFNLALKNRALWMLYPDFDNKKPMLYAIDPACFYGELDYNGNIPRCFLIWEEIGRKIYARYPHARNGRFGELAPNDKHKVIEFWDGKYRRRWINDIEDLEHSIEHNLGYVPMRYTQDIHIPGSIDNLGNAYHSIAMAENFTDVLILTSREMRERLNAVPWASGGLDPENAKAALERKEILALESGERMGWAQAVDSQMGAQQHLQSLDELYRVITNWPRLRSGQIDSSIWTGAGIGAAQSGVSADTLDVRESIAYDLEWCDNAAIHMFKKMWGKQEHPLVIFEKERSVGRVKIIPNEDIPDDFRHELIVSPLGHDVVSKLVTLMQLFGQKIFDKRTVLEAIPGANPAEIMKRLAEDMQRDLKYQMMLQTGMQEIQQNAEMQTAAMQSGAMPQDQGAVPQVQEV